MSHVADQREQSISNLSGEPGQMQTRVVLHPKSLSPDPTYGRATTALPGRFSGLDLYPHALMSYSTGDNALETWGRQLSMTTPTSPVVLRPRGDGRVELVVDFGTEIDAALEVVLEVSGRVNLAVWFGESLVEAQGLVFGEHPSPLLQRHLGSAGRHSVQFDVRGFRFIRLLLQDLRGPATLQSMVAHAVFAFSERRGDLQCSDPRFQRAWQTSAYTARLCTRPNTLWDGIKRDRHGWFGDGRIIKLATDCVFFHPEPAEQMMESLPLEQWANGIPNYSFDALSMLRQHILTYGLDRPCIRPAYERAKAMLAWAQRTQTADNGFIKRTNCSYFFDIGFLDWSEMPVGGRFEELSWLQCKYVEGLRHIAQVAAWLGEQDNAGRWAQQAADLQAKVLAAFWRDGVGMIHTLNHVGPVPNPHLPGYDGHYDRTYVQNIRLGPSGPSRQAAALAVFAGVLSPQMRQTVLQQVFCNPEVTPIITAYFKYYELTARGHCGDGAGALADMRDYLSAMLEREDAATLWELWSADINDMRKYASHFDLNWRFPLSLCHGWGAGLVPMTAEFLLGISATAPGFQEIELRPAAALPMAFKATLPTPMGDIVVQRDSTTGEPSYQIPQGIRVHQAPVRS